MSIQNVSRKTWLCHGVVGLGFTSSRSAWVSSTSGAPNVSRQISKEQIGMCNYMCLILMIIGLFASQPVKWWLLPTVLTCYAGTARDNFVVMTKIFSLTLANFFPFFQTLPNNFFIGIIYFCKLLCSRIKMLSTIRGAICHICIFIVTVCFLDLFSIPKSQLIMFPTNKDRTRRVLQYI